MVKNLLGKVKEIFSTTPIEKLPRVDLSGLSEFGKSSIKLFLGEQQIGILVVEWNAAISSYSVNKIEQNEEFLFDGLRAQLKSKKESKPKLTISAQDLSAMVTITELDLEVIHSLSTAPKHVSISDTKGDNVTSFEEDTIVNGRLIASWHKVGTKPAPQKLFIELVHRVSGQPIRARMWLENESDTAPTLYKQLNLPQYVLTHSPFNITWIESIESSRTAGDVSQEWVYSEYGERPCWRVPEQQTKFIFPPQGISEEIEKGMLYAKEPRAMDGSTPIHSRFGKNTLLSIGPRADRRAYVPNPATPLDRLAYTTVERLVIEPIEPLEFDYDQSKAPTEQHIVATEVAVNRPKQPSSLPHPETYGDIAAGIPNAYLQAYLPNALADWASSNEKQDWHKPPANLTKVKFLKQLKTTIATQITLLAAAHNRVAEFRILNRNNQEADLNLTDGLKAKLIEVKAREKATLAPIKTKERQYISGVEGYDEKAAIWVFFKKLGESEEDANAFGLLQTIDFVSELQAVGRNPVAVSSVIRELSLSAIGGKGSFSASFDAGRTIFDITLDNGQINTLTKRRIGRIAGVFNHAEHVVVYARTAAPTGQFRYEQGEVQGSPNEVAASLENCDLGWTKIRKASEYVKIKQARRVFSEEVNAVNNSARVLHSSYFPEEEIKVNSAWGRSLKEGYEIPLWSDTDSTGYYPKPAIAITCFAGGDDLVDAWREKPQACYFYTTTDPKLGADADAWPAVLRVDASDKISYDLLSGFCEAMLPDEQVSALVMPSVDAKNLGDPRFQIAVTSLGPMNLAHNPKGGKDVLLAIPTRISLDRARRTAVSVVTDIISEKADPKQTFKEFFDAAGAGGAINPMDKAAELRTVEALLAKLPLELERGLAAFSLKDIAQDAMLAPPGDLCKRAKQQLIAKVDQVCDEALKRVKAPITNALNADTLTKQLFQPIYQIESVAKEHITDLQTSVSEQQKKISNILGKLDNDIEEVAYGQVRQGFVNIIQSPLFTATHQVLLRLAHTVSWLKGSSVFKNSAGELQKFQQDLTNVQQSMNGFETTLNQAITDLTNNVAKAVQNVKDAASTEKVPVEKVRIALKKLVKQFNEQKNKVPKLFEAITELFGKLLTDADAVLALILTQLEKTETLDAAVGEVKVKDAFESVLVVVSDVKKQLIAVITTAGKLTTDGLDVFTILEVIQHDIGANLKSVLTKAVTHLWAVTSTIAPKTEADLFDLSLLAVALEKTLDADIEKKIDKEVTNAKNVVRNMTNDFNVEVENQKTTIETWLKEFQNGGATFSKAKTLIADFIQIADTLQTDVANEIRKLSGSAKAAINTIDCAAIDTSIAKAFDTIRDSAKQIEQKAAETLSSYVSDLLDEETKRRLEEIDKQVKASEDIAKKYLPIADLGVKVANLFTKPWVLPNLDVNTLTNEAALEQYKSDLRTSPTVILFGEVATGLGACGIAMPSSIIRAGEYARDLEKDAKAFFKSFAGLPDFVNAWMDDLPPDAIHLDNDVDPITKKRTARVDVNYLFTGSPKRVFSAGPMALDIADLKIEAHSSFDQSGVNKTTAKITGDWMLAFSGQAMATFKAVKLEYASDGGFSFDLDPAKIEPHPSLKFITDLLKQIQDSLPPELELERDAKGQVVGASVLLVQKFPGLNLGGLEIGPFGIGSGFGLMLKNSQMVIESKFSLGTKSSPVFVQYGVYGGGAWIVVSAKYNDGKVSYGALIGMAIGSTKTINLANVASGSYTILIYFSAAFDENNTLIEAGISVVGSAKLLGYLNAHLSLVLSIVYDGHEMKGRGSLDVEIEICWCYSVRVRREVNHSF